MPAGSGNSQANDMQITDYLDALQRLTTGKLQKMDIGKVTFFKDGPDIKNINCYSNEEDKWRKSKINFISDNEIKINLEGKFITERGRINCSLRENTGEWRWLGIQFVLSDL